MGFESAPQPAVFVPEGAVRRTKRRREALAGDSVEDRRRADVFGFLGRHKKALAALGLVVTGSSITGFTPSVIGSALVLNVDENNTLARIPPVQDIRAVMDVDAQVGGRYIEASLQAKRRKLSEKKDVAPLPHVENLEALNIAPDFFHEYLQQAFPRGWIDGAHVARMEFSRAGTYVSDAPGIEGSRIIAWCSTGSTEHGTDIVFTDSLMTPPVPNDAYTLFTKILPHEIAHAQDWASSPNLSPRQAFILQKKVLEFSNADGRPQYSYPDSIHALKPEDTQRANRDRAQEYFAELITDGLQPRSPNAGDPPQNWDEWRASFSFDLAAFRAAEPQEAQKNAALVQWVFQNSDPDFKPWVAAEATRDMLTGLMNEIGYQHIEDALGSDMPQDLKDVLVQGFEHRLSSSGSREVQVYLDSWYSPGQAGEVSTPEIFRAHIEEAERLLPQRAQDMFYGWQRITVRMLEIREGRDRRGPAVTEAAWSDLSYTIKQFVDLLSLLSDDELVDVIPVFERYAEALLYNERPTLLAMHDD